MKLGQAWVFSVIFGRGNVSAFVIPEELKLLEYNSSCMSTQRKADGKLRILEVERRRQFFVLKE